MRPYRVLAFLTLGVACVITSYAETIVHDRDSEAGRKIAKIDAAAADRTAKDKAFQDKARKTAEKFMEHILAGEVDKLMSMTSPLTLKRTGKDRVKVVYTEQVVPAFSDAKITWNSTSRPTSDKGYNGYEISGTAKGKTEFPFYIFVFEEDGRLVVGTISTRTD